MLLLFLYIVSCIQHIFPSCGNSLNININNIFIHIVFLSIYSTTDSIESLCCCFWYGGNRKKKKKPVTGQHRGVQLKKKKKTKQNKKTALLARSNALLWELTISYLAVVIPIVLYYIVDCGTSRYTAVLHSFYIDSLFFFVDIKI